MVTVSNCVFDEEKGQYEFNYSAFLFPTLDECVAWFEKHNFQSPLLKPYHWVFYSGVCPYKFTKDDKNILFIK